MTISRPLPKEIQLTLTPSEFYEFLDHSSYTTHSFAIFAKAREIAKRLPRRTHATEGSCRMCDLHRKTPNEMMPHHDASYACESGGHAHCTCDTCF